MNDQPDERDRDLPERVEAILEATACLDRDSHKYPMRREELAVEYADHELDLPNETESLGSVFDRLVDRRYESPAEAREAVVNELTGEEAGLAEFNDERALAELAADTHAVGAVDDEEGE
ncbi:MAG: hypothetical protein ABEJ05_00280 [Haloglomus sp.]